MTFKELKAHAVRLWEQINAVVAPLLPHDLGVRWALLLFVAILLAAFGTQCRKAEDADLHFEAGSTIARGETPVLGLVVAYPGPLDTSIEGGFTLIGSSTYGGEHQSSNIALHVAIVDGFGPVDVGLGVATMQNEDAYNSGDIQFMPFIRWWITDQLYLVLDRHFSNAGSRDDNLGRDMALLGWRFDF